MHLLSTAIMRSVANRSTAAAALALTASARTVVSLASPSLPWVPISSSALGSRHPNPNSKPHRRRSWASRPNSGSAHPHHNLFPSETFVRGGWSDSSSGPADGAGRQQPRGTSSTSLAMTGTGTGAATATATAEERAKDDEEGGGGRSDAPPEPRLAALREAMERERLDCVLVPSDDPHLSEYVPTAYMRRGYLTDFHGSAGTALVTLGGAYLWTDSRYFNEAGLCLNADHWQLMRQGVGKVPTINKFLTDLAEEKRKCGLSKPLRVGIDPYVHPASFVKDLTEAFDAATKDFALGEGGDGDEEASEADPANLGEIVTLESNIVDEVWGDERPPVPTSPFRVHPLEYAGESVSDKVAKIRKEMAGKKATMSVFSALDDVAYLLNVRATGDVSTCPVGIGYVTVTNDDVVLYCDPAKLAAEDVRAHLDEACVVHMPYEDAVPAIERHVKASRSHRVWIDKSRANYALCDVVPESRLVDAQNAVTPMKACKNDAEMEGMRRAHVVDGAAMANFMAWLERTVVDEGRSVSEVEVDKKLTGFRAEQLGFVELSFPTIAGVGPNGAIIHYSAKEGTDLLKSLDTTQPILIDSGGQYTYGTTDVTRTWHFGEPTEQFVEMYTRVLKGNIGVDTMVFPVNTPGFVLDVFARKSLWDGGKDYGHGTGHGVGAALNVHEGPMSISPRWGNKEVMKKGMVVSNEPGYYEDGNYGIRIENLLEVAHVDPTDDICEEEGREKPPGQKTFLRFDKLTMIPIQKNLINVKMLSDEELDWLDSYHSEVLEKVSPLLEEGSEAMAWLKKSCEKIHRS